MFDSLGTRYLGLFVCAAGLIACPFASPVAGDTVVRFDTVAGSFDVQLFDSVAPNTVQNFLVYVHEGDYDNMFFQRLVPGFVLQGGATGLMMSTMRTSR